MSDDPKYNMKYKLKAYLLEKMNEYDELYNSNKLKSGTEQNIDIQELTNGIYFLKTDFNTLKFIKK